MKIKKNLFITSLITIVCCNVIMYAGEETGIKAIIQKKISAGLIEDLQEPGKDPLDEGIVTFQGSSKLMEGEEDSKGQMIMESKKERESSEQEPKHLQEIESDLSKLKDLELVKVARQSEFDILNERGQKLDYKKYDNIYATVSFAQKNLPIKLLNAPFNKERWIWNKDEMKEYTKPVNSDEVRKDIESLLDDVKRSLLYKLTHTVIDSVFSPIQSVLTIDEISTAVRKFAGMREHLAVESSSLNVYSPLMIKNLEWGLNNLPIVKQLITPDRKSDQLFVTYLPYKTPDIDRYYVHHVVNHVVNILIAGSTSGSIRIYAIDDKFKVRTIHLTEKQIEDAIVDPFMDYIQERLEEYLGVKSITETSTQLLKRPTYQSYLSNGTNSKYMIVKATKQVNGVPQDLEIKNDSVSWTSDDHGIQIFVKDAGSHGPGTEVKLPDVAYEQHSVRYTLKDYSFITKLLKDIGSGGFGLGALFGLGAWSLNWNNNVVGASTALGGLIGSSIAGYRGIQALSIPTKSEGWGLLKGMTGSGVVGAGIGGAAAYAMKSDERLPMILGALLGTPAGVLLYSLLKKRIYIDSDYKQKK